MCVTQVLLEAVRVDSVALAEILRENDADNGSVTCHTSDQRWRRRSYRTNFTMRLKEMLKENMEVAVRQSRDWVK